MLPVGPDPDSVFAEGRLAGAVDVCVLSMSAFLLPSAVAGASCSIEDEDRRQELVFLPHRYFFARRVYFFLASAPNMPQHNCGFLTKGVGDDGRMGVC